MSTREDLRPGLLSQLLGVQPDKAQAILEALAQVSSAPGAVCEFGVAQGYTSALIANEVRDENAVLHLFDSFEGLPKPTEKDTLKDDIFKLGSMGAYMGQMACARELVEEKLRAIKFPPGRVEIHAGFLENTLRNRATLPCLVKFAFVDVDFYEGTKQALEFLAGVTQAGSVVIVDDYDFFSSGAKTAVDEFVAKHAGEWTVDVRNFFVVLKRVTSAYATGGVAQVSPQPAIDIVVKTFPGDYEWLPFLFRSIEKYAKGWRQIVVIVEEQYEAPPLPDGAKLVQCPTYEGTPCPISRGIPIERLGAFRHSDADVLLFVDSDCVFCRPVDLQTDPTINAKRPVVLWREWNESQPHTKWRAPAYAALGFRPPYWTMLRYPFVFKRETLEACWAFCGGEERLRLIDLTDWETICNYAIVHRPNDVTRIHVSEAGPLCVWQFWNQGGAFHPLTVEQVREHGMGGGVQNAGVQAKMLELGLL